VSTQFATRLSLIAFFATLVQGVVTGAGFADTVQDGLAAMAVFYGLGWVLGELARLIVEESARAEVDRLLAAPSKPET